MSTSENKWIKHEGDLVPVPDGTIVNVKFRSGNIAKNCLAYAGPKQIEEEQRIVPQKVKDKLFNPSSCARYEFWRQSDNSSSDIVEYEIVDIAFEISSAGQVTYYG